jgi:hypothetical protein
VQHCEVFIVVAVQKTEGIKKGMKCSLQSGEEDVVQNRGAGSGCISGGGCPTPSFSSIYGKPEKSKIGW